jgi:hypothetical protein
MFVIEIDGKFNKDFLTKNDLKKECVFKTARQK